MDAIQQSLLVHAVMLMFAWVPFALVAFVVETWSEWGPRWWTKLVHPIRSVRDSRLSHATPAH